MKSLLVAICVLAVLLAPIAAHGDHDHSHEEEAVDESDVFVLSKDNFDQHLKDNEFVFAEFYAPWCGHCKRLTPDWAKLATKVKADGVKVSIAKLDATQAEEVATKIGVRGYPTIKFFRNGNAFDYEGGRSIDEMYNYVVRKSGPASKVLSTKEEVEKFVSSAKSKVLAYFADSDLAHWLEAATSGSLEDFDVGHVTDSSLFGDNKANSFTIHKEGDEPVKYSGEWIKDKIVSFVQSEGYPLVDELAQKIWQRSQSTSTPLIAAFVDSAHAGQKELVRNLAKKFKGKVLFSSSTQTTLAERWGASGKKIPTLILVNWVNGEPKMLVFDEESSELTQETGEKFITDALAGTYKSYRKSEPLPASNDEPVKILVGKNYEEIVNDNKKDVFVEFYAPWCGHCKKLSPIWDELGEAFEGDEHIVIAKMDTTANAAPEGVDIRGFPTLVFFPADNKNPGIPYSGERDLDNLVKFVKEKASHAVGGENGKVDL